MSTINGIDVILLLALVAAVVYIRHLQAMRALAYLDGFIDGRHKVRYPDLQETSHPGDVYDWERDGL